MTSGIAMKQEKLDQQIIRALQGRLSNAGVEELTQWRNESAENERHFREVEAIWKSMDEQAAVVRRPTAADVIRLAEQRKHSEMERQGSAGEQSGEGIGGKRTVSSR